MPQTLDRMRAGQEASVHDHSPGPGRKPVADMAVGLAEIPIPDVHTHLDAGHLSARGLEVVLLYHVVVSDLGSAGCPSRSRLSETPDGALQVLYETPQALNGMWLRTACALASDRPASDGGGE